MLYKFIVALLVLPTLVSAKTTTWKVSSGALQFTLKHMLHTVEGKSTEVKGLGKCESHCTFLVAAPLKSFSSNNSNRDSNMLMYTKAAANPMVELRTSVDPAPGSKLSTVEVKFSGKTHSYQVPILFTEEKGGYLVHSVVPMKLSDFGIERPELFGVSCEDDVPVSADLHIQTN